MRLPISKVEKYLNRLYILVGDIDSGLKKDENVYPQVFSKKK